MFKWLHSTNWSLHNPLKGWTLVHLTTDEAKLIVSTLTSAEQKVTLVLHNDWESWKHFEHSDCDKIRQKFACNVDDLKIALPKEPIQNDEVTTVAVLIPKRSPLAADRKSDRILMRVPVSIIFADKKFDSYTVDLSSGGFRFENSLPSWLAGYFTVQLATSGGCFELVCSIVDSSDRNYYRVEISKDPKNSQWLLYQDWFASLPQKRTA